MTKLEKQFNHHYEVLRSRLFQEGTGLGNEVPFFISTFSAEKQNEAEMLIGKLQERLQLDGTPVMIINLFQFCVKLLEADGVLEDYLEYELKTDKKKFQQDLNAELDVEKKLTPAISLQIAKEKGSLLFVTGVGAAYPLIRTHTILTNLQNLGRKQPTILFFPGRYTHKNGMGSALDLFGKLNEDRYYRAFHLNDYQI
jgi:hypothetical protein